MNMKKVIAKVVKSFVFLNLLKVVMETKMYIYIIMYINFTVISDNNADCWNNVVFVP